MIAHFDFFRFYNMLIIVACDNKDKILGYCGVKDGNELCQVFVYPEYRGSGLVHQLVWKAVEVAIAAGSDVLWGVAYPHVKDLYIGYITRFGATLIKEEQAEERIDGQWRGVFNITTVTADRRPTLHR